MEERNSNGVPSVSVTFPDGHNDILLLDKFYANEEDRMIQGILNVKTGFNGLLPKAAIIAGNLQIRIEIVIFYWITGLLLLFLHVLIGAAYPEIFVIIHSIHFKIIYSLKQVVFSFEMLGCINTSRTSRNT